jgi:protein-tyrosine phosphatase
MKKIIMIKIFVLSVVTGSFASIPPYEYEHVDQQKTSLCQRITNIPMDIADLLYYRIHEVVKGTFYRSAQLPPAKLGECIQKFGIKTIINLRTLSPDKIPQWWLEELVVAQAYNVKLVNIPMSTEVLPTKETIETLLKIYKDQNNFPILVHCAHGIHRTGLAAFLYLASIGDKNAAQQLSLKYCYAKMWGSEAFDLFCKIWEQSNYSLENYFPERYPKFAPPQHGMMDKSD